ncbi:MAG: hypothetical protein H6738_22385 [Alphaproteobacteria bacterium]|nr:hypothetical protein [Alphaproteobacteria bacterium]MCB9699549.1 hypothetical protein [Alphaproteobacteria bacterium]
MSRGREAPGVLLVSRSHGTLELSLQQRGWPTARAWTLPTARRLLAGHRFALVVVQADLGQEDGVDFAVRMKGEDALLLGPANLLIPYVVVGEDQIVVLHGREEPRTTAAGAVELLELVLSLLG